MLSVAQLACQPSHRRFPPTTAPLLQVLRFIGWFGERVPDSPLEDWRVRRVCILSYLEDDTMQVTEPTESNSGLQQVSADGV